MHTLKKWLVALDGSTQDRFLVENTRRLAEKIQPESIEFLLVLEKEKFPPVLLKEVPDIERMREDKHREKIRQLLKDKFSGHFPVYSAILYGGILQQILKHADDTEADLVIVNSSSYDSRGNYLTKLNRKLPCSVLTFPGKYYRNIEKVMVPTDFSDYARLALQKGISLLDKVEGVSLLCYHVYKDASWYYNDLAYTHEEVEEKIAGQKEVNPKLEEYAQLQMDEFVQSMYPGDHVEVETRVEARSNKESIDKKILAEIKRSQPDFLVIGARGENSIRSILLGSVPEKIIKRNLSCPVMLIKEKGETSRLIRLLTGRR
jgi:nucleotide-binding universal stress UspA family protein